HAYFHDADGPPQLTHKDRHGLEVLEELCARAVAETDHTRRRLDVEMIREAVAALHNNRRPPAPASVEFLHPPLVFIDYSYNPVASGEGPGHNPRGTGGAPPFDLGTGDPGPFPFWKRPGFVGAEEVYFGFGRTALPDLSPVWTYAGPKTSFGGSPGFE